VYIPDSAAGWLRLSLVKGIGPVSAFKLVRTCGSVSGIWRMGTDGWRNIDGLGSKTCAALAASSPAAATRILSTCQQWGIHLLCPDDPAYPESLREIPDAPLVLFVQGDPDSLQHGKKLAVVGSRRASREGKLLAKRWCHYLSDRGICVVSGMAYGIDQAAHEGALAGPTPTIAVLGCGLMALSSSQRSMVQAIAAQGCVLSEFPPATPARPEHFPQRNRIISGLSQATLVIEAAIKSGALITARLAAEQGREVMAAPGSVLTESHAGCHQLIRDGAMLVESAMDVLQSMGWAANATEDNPDNQYYTPANDIEAEIIRRLQAEILHIDTLAEECGLSVSDLSATLIGLELARVVESLPGSRYALIK